MIINPDGPQGNKIGVRITSREDVENLDKELGKIINGDNKPGIQEYTKAAIRAGLNIIKP